MVAVSNSSFTDASRNRCKRCVGGATGLAEDDGVDCKGGCSDKYQLYPALGGVCSEVGKNVTAIILRLYCDGVWRSGAKIDK